ncbi:MAG: kinase [Lysobacter sp.]
MTSSPQITPPGTAPRPAGYDPAFVAEVLDDALAHDCRVYSITGLQGTGKSTIAAQLVELARERGLHAVALSIDDFYLDHDERARLGREVHPLLATRGPPGSHDVALACEVVDALREGRSTRLPRFDKIADRRLPRTDWPVVDGVDLVLFEGWFQKVPAQLPDELSEPVNELERDEDPQGTWRTYCNTSLGNDYGPLWAQLDRLLFLQGPGFDQVPEWRWQQECTLQAANPGRAAMSRPQVMRFVQFFERVSRHAWQVLPGIADRTRRLDASRRPVD